MLFPFCKSLLNALDEQLAEVNEVKWTYLTDTRWEEAY